MEDDIKRKTNSNIKSETTTGQILHNFFLNKPNFTNLQPPLDENCKYEKWNISAEPGRIFLKSET